MPKFGKTSLQRLESVHPDLQEILHEAIKIIDFAVVCGHRGEKEQNEAYASKNSSLKWPNSKHNTLPSIAVDVVPWPTQYKDPRYIMLLSGIIRGIAHGKGIEVRWGGDWDGDGDMDDQNLKDPVHFELVRPK